jgi:hypothetical protein
MVVLGCGPPNDLRISCGPSTSPPAQSFVPQSVPGALWPHQGFAPLRPVGCMRWLDGGRLTCAITSVLDSPIRAYTYSPGL